MIEVSLPRSYAILKVQVIPSEETVVWLRDAQESKAFHCSSCGGFLFYRQHRIIATVEDDMSHVLHSSPVTFQCRKCNHAYHCHFL